MPEYLSPGVYVEEVDAGAKPIEGVSTSTAGFVGVTERGRVGSPELVTSLAQYVREFGRRLRASEYPGAWYLPHAIEGFFSNGGKRAYVVRVLPPTADSATVTLYDRGDTDTVFTTALASRAAIDDGYLVVDSDAGIGADDWLLLDDDADSEYLQVAGSDGAVIVVQSPLLDDVDDGDDVRFYDIAATGTARTLNTDVAAGDTQLDVNTIASISDGDLLRIDDGAKSEYVRVQGAPAAGIVTISPGTVFAHSADATAGVEIRRLQAPALQGTATESVGDAEEDTHLVTVVDDTDAATGNAVGFGAAPTMFHPIGQALIIRLETSLAATIRAGVEVVEATLTTTTGFNLTADASTGDTTVDVDNLTGIAAGTILLFDGGTASAEYAVVDGITGVAPNPGEVDLRDPLQYDHTTTSAATTIVDDTPTAAGPGFPPSTAVLARTALVGDDVVILSDDGGIATGSVLRFGAAGSTDVEYHVVDADDLDLVPLDAPVDALHVAGTAVRGRSAILRMQAIDPGAWGNCLRVTAEDDDPLLETTVASAGSLGDPTLELTSGVGIETGSVLEFYDVVAGADVVRFRQKVQGRLGNIVSFAAGGLSAALPTGTRARTREFRLTIECWRTNVRTGALERDLDMSETFRSLSLDPRHSRYVETVIGEIPAAVTDEPEGESALVKVEDLWASATAESTIRLGPDPLTQTVNGQTRPLGRALSGGDDDIVNLVSSDFVGTDAVDPEDRTGTHALKNIEEISIIAMPGRTAQVEQNALVTQCERLRYRVAVLDSRPGDGIDDVTEHRNLYDTKYAALYYPWLEIPDPFPRNPRVPLPVRIPPSGHVIGIYARSDNTRGVHKAPANEVVRGITGLEVKVTTGEHDILNPRNINVIRDFREQGRGLRVWGARVTTSDASWRYLNVRRLFNFVEHSLDRGTQWVVFEPNDHRLWARVNQSVSNFLTRVWKDGALMGRTPEEAYFVKVDETTMTTDDIDNGRLIMVIGIAPVKPAEFVIIRIGQWAGGSSVQEL